MSLLEMNETLRKLVQQNGVKGLWKGVMPTLFRDVPFSAIYWSQYEALKRLYGPGVPSFSFSFLAGFISGAVRSFITRLIF